MTIKADNANSPLVAVNIQTLHLILVGLPVEVVTNRLYIAENNRLVMLNFTYNKIKYLLRLDASDRTAYKLSMVCNRWAVREREIIYDTTIAEQIMELFKTKIVKAT